MSKYTTEQRRELISFLKSNPDKQFSARDIAKQMQSTQISISAIYRNLSVLETSGYICRVAREGSRESYYQYLASEPCKNSIHLTCTKCGKIFHMNVGEADRMVEGILKSDGFQVNTVKTVVVGVCKHCV